MRDDRNDQKFSKLALSISEVVRASGVGRTLVFAEIKAGRLIAHKCGRRTLILEEDYLRWLRALPVVKVKTPLGSATDEVGQ
jgi:hypothetical protein